MSNTPRIVTSGASPTIPQKSRWRGMRKIAIEMILGGIIAYLIAEGGAYLKGQLERPAPWPASGTYLSTFAGRTAKLDILSTAEDGARLAIEEDKFILHTIGYDHNNREWKIEVICRDTMGTRSTSAIMKFEGINENAIALYPGLAEASEELHFKRQPQISSEPNPFRLDVPIPSNDGK